MPITQTSMIAQMQESRAAIQNDKALRHLLLNYLASAKERYAANRDLVEVIVSTMTIINMHPYSDDRVTYRNEWHYKRVAHGNEVNKQRQANLRRMEGVLTQDESMERLNLLNAARRSGEIPAQTYRDFNTRSEPKTKRKRKKDELIMPQDHPDDKPLEFDTLEDMPKPEGTFVAPTFSLDEPEDKY